MTEEEDEKWHEKRKSKRYNTEVKIHFQFAYDLETKVKFELVDYEKDVSISKKYSAVSQNISAEGLSFISEKDVKKGDQLNLEVYLPSAKVPIMMKGEVKWCLPYSKFTQKNADDKKYTVGVEIESVNEGLVSDSVYFDDKYGVRWSVVLESVLGNYKMLMGDKYKKNKD